MTDCVFCEIVKSENAEGFRREGPGVVSFIPLNVLNVTHKKPGLMTRFKNWLKR